MKTRSAVGALCLLLTAFAAKATPVLTVGTPADSLLSKPSSASPSLGGTKLNFDNLTAFSSFSSYSASGITISSPDGLVVLPYSTQSGPNELYDNSTDGSANLLISLSSGVNAIGVGIADADPVNLEFVALGQNGADLGAFLVNLAATESSVNTGNGYYVIGDTTPDIYGLLILQPVGNDNYSGLAIDDVQVTPEPASLTLLGTGLLGLAGEALRRRKRA
jgi:MYXO-CTERM domain-containing protein